MNDILQTNDIMLLLNNEHNEVFKVIKNLMFATKLI